MHRKITIKSFIYLEFNFLQFRFCLTRWIEDQQMAEQAIEVWVVFKVITLWCVDLLAKDPKKANHIY